MPDIFERLSAQVLQRVSGVQPLRASHFAPLPDMNLSLPTSPAASLRHAATSASSASSALAGDAPQDALFAGTYRLPEPLVALPPTATHWHLPTWRQLQQRTPAQEQSTSPIVHDPTATHAPHDHPAMALTAVAAEATGQDEIGRDEIGREKVASEEITSEEIGHQIPRPLDFGRMRRGQVAGPGEREPDTHGSEVHGLSAISSDDAAFSPQQGFATPAAPPPAAAIIDLVTPSHASRTAASEDIAPGEQTLTPAGVSPESVPPTPAHTRDIQVTHDAIANPAPNSLTRSPAPDAPAHAALARGAAPESSAKHVPATSPTDTSPTVLPIAPPAKAAEVERAVSPRTELGARVPPAAGEITEVEAAGPPLPPGLEKLYREPPQDTNGMPSGLTTPVTIPDAREPMVTPLATPLTTPHPPAPGGNRETEAGGMDAPPLPQGQTAAETQPSAAQRQPATTPSRGQLYAPSAQAGNDDVSNLDRGDQRAMRPQSPIQPPIQPPSPTTSQLDSVAQPASTAQDAWRGSLLPTGFDDAESAAHDFGAQAHATPLRAPVIEPLRLMTPSTVRATTPVPPTPAYPTPAYPTTPSAAQPVDATAPPIAHMPAITPMIAPEIAAQMLAHTAPNSELHRAAHASGATLVPARADSLTGGQSPAPPGAHDQPNSEHDRGASGTAEQLFLPRIEPAAPQPLTRAAPAPAPELTLRLTIARVEVRQSHDAVPPPAPRRSARPTLSLDTYLGNFRQGRT